MNRAALSIIAAVLGVVLIVFAAFAWDWRAGAATVGGVLIIVGWFVDGGVSAAAGES